MHPIQLILLKLSVKDFFQTSRCVRIAALPDALDADVGHVEQQRGRVQGGAEGGPDRAGHLGVMSHLLRRTQRPAGSHVISRLVETIVRFCIETIKIYLKAPPPSARWASMFRSWPAATRC